MKKLNLLLIIVFLLPFSLPALDFGFLLDQNAKVGGGGSQDASGFYQADFIPHISGLLGDASGGRFGEFIVTAGFSAGTDKPYFIPELLRTEVTMRFGNAKITAGRMQYTAPFAGIADGLFDGLHFAYDTKIGTLSAGGWYTGGLYKKKANITMTKDDKESFLAVVDYGDFAGTYFASRRMVAAVGWEHQAIAEVVRAKLAVIAQFDLNDRNEYLNSQYITLKVGIPINQFMIELGGVVEPVQTDGGSKVGLAGELGVFWILPTTLTSRISFNGYFSGVDAGSGTPGAFIPITSKTYGAVLEAEPSGITALSLDYTARLHKTFSAGINSTYFIRNDLVTFTGYPADGKPGDNYFLGNEFFAQLTWSPVSDLQINLGGGIFLPSMGNAAPESDPLWRIKIAAVFSF